MKTRHRKYRGTQSMRKFKNGLVLSGGAARGLSHIGTIAELDRFGLEFDVVAGTSMGAIVGALYGLFRKPRTIYEYVQDYLNTDQFRRNWLPVQEGEIQQGSGFFHRFLGNVKKGIYYTKSLTRISLIPPENYEEIINTMVDDIMIEDLPIKYGAVAVDIDTGEEVVICSGSLRKALAASCAIPGILPPVNVAGRRLIDGGWLDNLPVVPAFDMGSSFVIASDSSWDSKDLEMEPQCALDVVFRSNDVTRIFLNRMNRAMADVLIVPEVGHILWYDFDRMAETVAAGREAARQELRFIRWKRLVYWMRTMGGVVKRRYTFMGKKIVYV